MSTTDGWDLTVPKDAAELLAELRRHGVEPGQRLHIVRSTGRATEDRFVARDTSSEDTPSRQPKDSADEAVESERLRRRLRFTGMLKGAESDLSERTDDYLRQSVGRE